MTTQKTEKKEKKLFFTIFQAAADDEISFDPNDVITNIEMVKNMKTSILHEREA